MDENIKLNESNENNEYKQSECFENIERNLEEFNEDLNFSYDTERKYFDEIYFRNSKLFKL